MMTKNTGIRILGNALESPLRQIAENAGHEGSVVCNRVRAESGNFGFNAATGEYGDMVKWGIIDPTKVARSALQHAASVAGIMITTEAMVTEIEEPKPAPPAGGAPDMGGMGGGMM